MRLPLVHLEAFCAIARNGSVRAAADALGLQPSTLSHQLKALEQTLAVALFVRTTRSMRLTEAGKALHDAVSPAFAQLEGAVRAVGERAESRRHLLRINLPEFAYELVVRPRLAKFFAAHPGIELELSTSDAMVDIASDGFHAGMRIGDHIKPDMVAVRLTNDLKAGPFASPAYLREHGSPQAPDDLLRHNCIRYRFGTSGRIADWEFQEAGGVRSLVVAGNSIVSALPTLVSQAEAGIGIGYTFIRLIEPQLRQDVLVAVLKRNQRTYSGVHLYFPKEYRSLPALRAFIGFFGVKR